MCRSKVLLGLTMMLSAGMLQCRTSQRPISRSQANDLTMASRESMPYREALNGALRNAASDELERTLSRAERVTMSGSDIECLSRLRVTQEGNLVLLDFDRAIAELYNPSGEFVRAIGGKGAGPGNYEWPSGIAQRKDGTLAVCDFRVHRVNMYSAQGDFLESFIYSPQVFSAQQIEYDNAADCFYLFGNRWQNGTNGKPLGADLVHKYSSAGEFLGSQLSFPERGKPLDLYGYDDPAIDIAGGRLFVALPFDYAVYSITPDGSNSQVITRSPGDFRAPSRALEAVKKGELDPYNVVQEWLLSWTPINGLFVEGDRLFLQYQTFSPLRYTIDTWSLGSGKRLASHHTNHAMIAKDQAGFVYFLNNLEARGRQKYEILRTKVESL